MDRMSVLAEKVGRAEAGSLKVTPRRLAVWASLGLICIAAVASLLLMQGIERQLRDVTDTHLVRTAARELSNALIQAEASQRGFLLTEDERFLEPYQQAASSIESRLDALLTMTFDDPQQSSKVQSIVGDLSGKLAEMARAVELVVDERPEEAQSLTQTGMGARLMAEVSQTLEDFIAEEDQKLARRNNDIDRTRLGLVVALLAALAAAAILAYALLTRTQRQVSALTLRHRGLQSQNEALEAKIVERTRDIEGTDRTGSAG